MGVFNTAEKIRMKKKCKGMPRRPFQSSVDRWPIDPPWNAWSAARSSEA